MSGPQLAARLGVSKSQGSQIERMEAEDRITLKQLRRVAETLDCDLVYALVPRHSVSKLIADQAGYKAQQLAAKVDIQMQLENQQLSKPRLNKLIEIEKDRLLRQLPRELWDD
ncbi:MAG: helix-turn-helix domain-containing protein [Xanthomonadales bacterium]|nr:helix-turn-helix domain-containing protein [Xanthomonadales bacterium]